MDDIQEIIIPNNSTGDIKITRIPCIRNENVSRNKVLSVIFCLPGNSFSAKFMQSWTRLLIHCMNHGINSEILHMYSSNIYHVREALVSAMVMGDTPNVRPFGGKKYDYIMWIDSDQTFTPDDFERLIVSDVDIVSGAIKVGTGSEFAFGWFDERIAKEGGELLRMKSEDIEGRRGLIEVDFCGFAFTLVKFGCFESLRFPYFEALSYSVYPQCREKLGMMGEDLSTFYRLRKNGFKVYINPVVRIGHEKSIVLQ